MAKNHVCLFHYHSAELRSVFFSEHSPSRMAANTMAGNLTTEVRGFAQISAAAIDDDFTRFTTVKVSGVKTQISQIVYNLRDDPEEHRRP